MSAPPEPAGEDAPAFPSQEDAPVAATAHKGTLFDYFQKSDGSVPKRKAESEPQTAAGPARKKAKSKADDDEKPQPRKKKVAKKPNGNKKQVTPEPEPLPPPSSALQSIHSVRTEIDPLTASAASSLTTPPSSSPGSLATVGVNTPERAALSDAAFVQEAVEAVVDLNDGRRKRRRRIEPPSVPTRVLRKRESDKRVQSDPEHGEAGVTASSPSFMPWDDLQNVEVEAAHEEVPAISSSPPESVKPWHEGHDFENQAEGKQRIIVIKFSKESEGDRYLREKWDECPSQSTVEPSASSPASTESTPPQTQIEGQPNGGDISPEQKQAEEKAVPEKRNAYEVLGKKKVSKDNLRKKGSKEAVCDKEANEDRQEEKAKPAKRIRKPTKKKKKTSPTVDADDEMDAEDKSTKPTKRKRKPAVEKQKPPASPLLRTRETTTAKTPDPGKEPQEPKAIHPYFSSLGRKQISEKKTPKKTKSISNASSPKSVEILSSPEQKRHRAMAQTSGMFPKQKPSLKSEPLFGSASTKVPGTIEAPWPTKESSHVRGFILPPFVPFEVKDRKLKFASMVVPDDENLLHGLAKSLNIKGLMSQVKPGLRKYQDDKWFDPAPEVRKPERLVMTGAELQDRIRREVSVRLPHPDAKPQPTEFDSDDDMAVDVERVHPALSRTYSRIRTELSPFDRMEREQQSWDVKYAPATVDEVLQPPQETRILTDWLTGLVTHSTVMTKKKSKKAGPRKKKKKRRKGDLDGWMVDSDEEAEQMTSISESSGDENDWLNPKLKRKGTTIRAGDKLDDVDGWLGREKDGKKLTNAVVISGPTACGKTAAVYAAARQCGYSVFEVSPGMRRNGKDILDLVGDMTGNHQIGNIKRKVDPFSRAKQANGNGSENEVGQRQAVILFEEVDVLFEEDRSFWSTVTTLLSKSKRPVIMTCNDESLLPLDNLSLHAVIRLSKPSPVLVTDHLLLIAANEGHLLQRREIETLVKANKGDLRRCLADLQFWLRMGLCDRASGMGWSIDRFPPGLDLGANDEPLRVVSKDTYFGGMGFVNRALSVPEEDKYHDIWDEWGVDVLDEELLDNKLPEYIDALVATCSDEEEKRGVGLKSMDRFLVDRSDADTVSGRWMAADENSNLDPMAPKKLAKHRDDVLGYKTLDASVSAIPSAVVSMSLTHRLLARSRLALSPVADTACTAAIIDRDDNPPVRTLDVQKLLDPLSKKQLDSVFSRNPASAQSVIYHSSAALMLDVAPAVRTILRADVEKEKVRRYKSGLVSLGGMRRTRAARIAREGGDRRKKERWFGRHLGVDVLEKTAGEWGSVSASTTVSSSGVDDDGDVEMVG